MASFFSDVGVAFVPIFVAIDAIGAIPIILSLTKDVKPGQRTRMLDIAIFTAAAIGVGFLFLGKTVLNLLDISVNHFAIAGGIVLLILALRDIIGVKSFDTPIKEEMLEIVPIGTPLTAGPGAITTLLIIRDQYSAGVALVSFVLNLAVAWVVFQQGDRIAAFLGQGGLKAVSKVASLLLTAIAIRLILNGFIQIFTKIFNKITGSSYIIFHF